jgi:TAG lipase / steryl ester hydrolase / phospholipase A2 / LPA acyltransferase
VDGAVTDDLPAKRLARLYGVNHYMVSMANPVALALIKSDDLWPGPRALKKVWRHANQEWLRVSEQFSRRYLGGAPDVSKALNIFYSLYGQEYTGDINIMPSFRLVDPRKVLWHLTAAEIEELDWEGQRATWPLVEQIRLSTQIDRTLDGILNRHDGHDARRHY